MPPFYEYECKKGHAWEVAKRIAAIDDPEACPSCGETGARQLTLPMGSVGASDWNNQSFNPGLGCFTRSNKHAEQIARARGLEPVGNEKPSTIHKTMEKQREETRAQRWADASREKVYE